MKVLGIYHSADLDGKACAAIIKMRYPEVTLMPYDYGEEYRPIYKEAVRENYDLIIMADVCLPTMSHMNALAGNGKRNLVWIDHHRSQIKEYREMVKNKTHPPFKKAILKEGVAACELTWKHLFPNNAVPDTIFLLGKYDTWRQETEVSPKDGISRFDWHSTLSFQWGMRVPLRNSVWGILSVIADEDDGLEWTEVQRDGGVILEYQDVQNQMWSKNAFESKLGEHPVIALNTTQFNSQAFKDVYDSERHDIMVAFAFNGKKWKVSLYSDKPDIDCGAIAKGYRGGGHKGAAGFLCNILPLPNFFQLAEI